MSNISNKERGYNFSAADTNKLMVLLKDFPILTSKKTDHSSNAQKEAAWRELAKKFNSDTTSFRTVKQLQQKFNNLKKAARMEMDVKKYGRRLTRGGPAPPKPSETTEWLNSIMGESISGLPAICDSDAQDTERKEQLQFTPLETQKHIIQQSEKKIEYMTQEQEREMMLIQYTKQEHEINLKHKEEIHEMAIEHKKQIFNLEIEKKRQDLENSKLETERLKVDLEYKIILLNKLKKQL